jgi:cellulose biosynthesis protein BcsQ
VLAVSSNKGGVGKTTLAANLAIYLRALREDLPVAVVGLDDQRGIDRMFALRPPQPGEGNLKHGWAERSLDRVLQLGQYGIHFVPSPGDVTLLKARAEDPTTLGRILERTSFAGLFVLDTKSDLEALTENAFHAADRILVPVADWASLEEAAKTLRLLDRLRLPVDRARIVLTLVDRRTRGEGEGPLHERLAAEIERRGWPRYATALSRSPRVERLNSGSERPRSILHHARGTAVHAELRALAEEVLADLEALGAIASVGPPRASGAPRDRSAAGPADAARASDGPAAVWGPRASAEPADASLASGSTRGRASPRPPLARARATRILEQFWRRS